MRLALTDEVRRPHGQIWPKWLRFVPKINQSHWLISGPNIACACANGSMCRKGSVSCEFSCDKKHGQYYMCMYREILILYRTDHFMWAIVWAGLTQPPEASFTNIVYWKLGYAYVIASHNIFWNVINQPCPKLNGCLAKPRFDVWAWCVIHSL